MTPIVIGYILGATGSFNGALVFVGANAARRRRRLSLDRRQDRAGKAEARLRDDPRHLDDTRSGGRRTAAFVFEGIDARMAEQAHSSILDMHRCSI